MKQWMRRLIAVMLVLCMVLPFAVMAQDDEDITIEQIMLDDEEDAEDEAELAGVFDFSDADTSALIDEDTELDTSVDPANLNLNTNLPDNVINILLMGVDTRSKDLDTGLQHNDVNMVLSVNRDTGEIKLTSLLRDLYVEIPGYKNNNRLNIAYARGGGELAMSTVNKNFDMNIQYYVTINFFGLASIIDALGGIDIELTKTEAIAINAYLKKHPPAYDNVKGHKRTKLERKAGVQHLDGVQAVMYARLREIDNDFARTGRQRHLMELLLNKVVSGGLTADSLINLITTCAEYVHTNLNMMTMYELATGVLASGIMDRASNGEELLQQFRVPMEKAFSYKDINGMSVVYLSSKYFPINVQAMHEFIYGAYYPPEN